jgi:CheY-like chemotaxis protein/HPt (histidine-containing phosphotransfer) domain-containing protein
MHQALDEGEPFSMVLLDNMMPEMDGFELVRQIQQLPTLVGAILMMLSSADRHENAARCQELGMQAYLTKPIRRTELLSTILTAVHAAPKEVSQARAFGHAFEQCQHSLRLLLTEDNLVNQKLALRLLEKRGHSVLVVANGRQAVEVLREQSFDVVLMDVQMPEMDGFEATRIIRERELDSGGHVPIVAMTAHAMKGDRERCLEVGMDGYVSKPLHPTELFKAVESLGNVSAAGGRITSRRKPDGVPTFDMAAALDITGGDVALMREIIAVFVEEYPVLLKAFRDGVAHRDAANIQRIAHSLRGAVGAFGPTEAQDLAEQLETMAQNQKLAGAEEALRQLERALDELRVALQAVR